MTVLLLDDERSFKDGRSTLVARRSTDAADLVKDLTELDELWLDYVLIGSDSADEFLWHLITRKREGNPLTLHKVYIHTSSFMAVSLLEKLLADLDVPKESIERVNHQDYFIVAGRR